MAYMDSGEFVKSFRSETARVRNLSAECRQAGIFLEELPEELEVIRGLVHAGRMDAALERMREIKLDLLARLLLQGPDEIPPAQIENAPAKVFPLDATLSAINGRAERGPPSTRPKPSP